MTEAKKRRRVFGPLFYATLVLGVLGLVVRGALYVDQAGTEWRRYSAVRDGVSSPDAPARARAYTELRAWPTEESQPILIAEARDAHANGRAEACWELAQTGKNLEELVPLLLDAGQDPREEVRERAVAALAWLLAQTGGNVVARERAMPERLETLRGYALEFFGRLAAEDGAESVRAAAVTAVADCATPVDSASVLEAATRDPKRSVRLAAGMALLKTKGADDPLAARTLVAYIADPAPIPDRVVVFQGIMETRHDPLRQQAVQAIATLMPKCEPAILPELILCLEVAGRQAAAAVPALEKLAKQSDDPVVRGRAGIAVADLLEFHDLSEVNLFEDIFEAPRISGMVPTEEEMSGKAEVVPYSPRVVAVLRRVMGDEAIGLEWRQGAILRLGHANPGELTDAAGLLIRQLGNEDPKVRVIAHRLLGQIVLQTPVKISELGGSK